MARAVRGASCLTPESLVGILLGASCFSGLGQRVSCSYTVIALYAVEIQLQSSGLYHRVVVW
jgi:hypothetical protein